MVAVACVSLVLTQVSGGRGGARVAVLRVRTWLLWWVTRAVLFGGAQLGARWWVLGSLARWPRRAL